MPIDIVTHYKLYRTDKDTGEVSSTNRWASVGFDDDHAEAAARYFEECVAEMAEDPEQVSFIRYRELTPEEIEKEKREEEEFLRQIEEEEKQKALERELFGDEEEEEDDRTDSERLSDALELIMGAVDEDSEEYWHFSELKDLFDDGTLDDGIG